MNLNYSRHQLKTVFELVEDKTNWKNPIDKFLPKIYDEKLIAESIEFFTGTKAIIVDVYEDRLDANNIVMTEIRVTAPGYYAGPCN